MAGVLPPNRAKCPFSAPHHKRPFSRRTTYHGILASKRSVTRPRFHDLRHHATTELAETAPSDRVIRSIAGHVSQKMLEHFSHMRLEAKHRALDALAMMRPGNPNQGDSEGGASHGTSQ
jgi:integrase